MNKKLSNWVPFIVVPLGGLLMLGLTFFGYLLVYLTIESVFFAANPQSMDTGLVRRGFMVFIVLVYLLLEKTKLPKLLKATIMVGPYAMVLVTIVLQYYQHMLLAMLLVIIFIAFSLFIIRLTKRPWFYCYAAGIAILAGLFYGWPR